MAICVHSLSPQFRLNLDSLVAVVSDNSGADGQEYNLIKTTRQNSQQLLNKGLKQRCVFLGAMQIEMSCDNIM